MGEEPQREIIDILHAKNPDSRCFSQNFLCYQHSVSHENRLQVQKSEGKEETLQIKNYFATVSQEQVVKVTEIQLEDRIIRILDYFTCTSNPQDSQGHTELEPVQSFPCENNSKHTQKRPKLTIMHECQDEYRMRDRKNVVKNIFRLFQSWVQERSPVELQLDDALEELMMNNKGKYNNNLVVNLAKNPLLRKAFLIFSETTAEELIGQSRINDKLSHISALRNYRKMCLKEQMIVESNGEVPPNKEEKPIQTVQFDNGKVQ